jgi:hypothetical protein
MKITVILKAPDGDDLSVEIETAQELDMFLQHLIADIEGQGDDFSYRVTVEPLLHGSTLILPKGTLS